MRSLFERGAPIKATIQCGCAVLALACAASAQAETAAGSVIVNVANLTFDLGGQRTTIASNPHQLIVAERLDVTLTATAPTTRDDGTVAIPLTLTNPGNGSERFTVTASASTGHAVEVAADSDGDGRFDPAHDLVLGDSGTAPLGPSQSILLFAVAADPSGTVTVAAAAATGSGQTGTTFPAAGDGGSDAVTGPTGARASIAVPLAGSPAPALVKSASVAAPDGSASAVRGATITYTLVARFPAAISAAEVTDPIPAGTAYVPASLRLDDAPLSDAADADAGQADPAGIRVTLGDQPAGAVRTLRFQVVIQ